MEGTTSSGRYIRELRWAQHFALLNREEMMDRVVGVRRRSGSGAGRERGRARSTATTTTPQQEKHFGKEVWLSRKGAIDAHRGQSGPDPGSMGTRVLRRRGPGQPARAALLAARRRAAATPGRAAREAFTQDELREAMAGIEYRDTDAFIDEIPRRLQGHRPVMADAADLVEVRTRCGRSSTSRATEYGVPRAAGTGPRWPVPAVTDGSAHAHLVHQEGELPGLLLPRVVPAAAAAVPGHHLGAQQDRPLAWSLVDRLAQPRDPLGRLDVEHPGVVQAGGRQDRRVLPRAVTFSYGV